MIPTFVVIKRHWYELRRHVLSWVIFIFLLPILLYMVFGLSLFKIIPSVHQLTYFHWVAPGIWISSTFIMAYLTAFMSTFQIRRSNRLLSIYLKAPISCWTWLAALMIWATILGTVQMGVSLMLIGFINGAFYTIFKWAMLLIMIFPSVLFGAALGTFTGSWIRKQVFAMLVNIVIVIVFLSLSGSFIPLLYFPASLQAGLSAFPMVQEIRAAQRLILYSEVQFGGTILTILLAGILFVLNGVMVQRRVRR